MVMDQKPPHPEAQTAADVERAIRKIVADSAELRPIVTVVHAWADEYKGITLSQSHLGRWYVKCSNGLKIETPDGQPLSFITFHELLDWLLFTAPDYR